MTSANTTSDQQTGRPKSAAILNISLDLSLLRTRHAILQKGGYNVLSVSTWSEFELACHEKEFDLVILGQTLPPSLKRDMMATTRKVRPKAKVAELYVFSPEVPDAAGMRVPELDPKELLAFVERVLAEDSIHPTGSSS